LPQAILTGFCNVPWPISNWLTLAAAGLEWKRDSAMQIERSSLIRKNHMPLGLAVNYAKQEG
jgi:hypothetical protein